MARRERNSIVLLLFCLSQPRRFPVLRVCVLLFGPIANVETRSPLAQKHEQRCLSTVADLGQDSRRQGDMQAVSLAMLQR